MKTWLIVPEFPLGGAERQMFELAKLNKEQFQFVDLKSPIENRVVDGTSILGLNIDVLNQNVSNRLVRVLKRLYCFLKVAGVIKRANIGCVVFYNPIFLSLAYYLKKTTNIKVCFSIREYKKSIFSNANYVFLKSLDLVYTNTPRVKSKLNELNIKCELVLNVLDVRCSHPTPSRHKNTLLVISNLEPHKCIHILLQATKGMDFTINIAGRLSNKSYYEFCQEIASSSNCKVNFLGSVSQQLLNELLANTSCLVHPSVLEGTSNAILDAIISETPLLVSDIPENSYLVDELDCFLFNANSNEDLNFKLQQLLKEKESDEVVDNLKYLKMRLFKKFSSKNLKKIESIVLGIKS